MATKKIRYLTERPGRSGPRFFWQPPSKLKPAGWTLARLADEFGQAVGQAEALNAALDAWRRKEAPPLPIEHRDLILQSIPDDVARAITAPAPASPTEAPIPKNVKPGTLRALIHAYRHSHDFAQKALKTRTSYNENIRALELWQVTAAGGVVADEPPLEYIAPSDLKALWEALFKKTPTKANAVLGMARILFSYGRTAGHYHGYFAKDARGHLVRDSAGRPIRITENPAKQLQLKSVRPHRTEDDLWTPEEVQIFSAVADAEGWFSVGLAVELNEWMGQRQGDVLALKMDRYRQGRLDVTQGKTKADVFLPVDLVPQLQAALTENQRRKRESGHTVTALTLLVCESTGRSWKKDHFRHAFADVREVAAQWCPSLAKKTFLTLRHTAVVRLAEAGCTPLQISAITGHTLVSVNNILERYHVRTKKAAETAFRKRLAAENAGLGEA